MSADDQLEDVAICIRTALKQWNKREDITKIGGPHTATFGLWLAQQLTLKQIELLQVLGEEKGGDQMHDWLNGVLVSTGLYRYDGDGFAVPSKS